MKRHTMNGSRLIAICLTLALLCGMLPVGVLAADTDSYTLATTIEPGKSYVLVADGQYALNNTAVTWGSYGGGTDTLGSTPVTIVDDKIVGEVDESLLWTIEEGTDVPTAPIYDEVQYFLYDQNGEQLMRRSGSTGTAPLQVGGSYSRIHYITISFHQRADGSYTVFFNTDRSDDYPFSFTATADGVNAPGVAQSNWDPETYGSAFRLYELAEGSEDDPGNEPDESDDYEIVITCPDKYTKTQSDYKYGEVIKTSYYSTTCKRTKNVNIQLPAGYDESKSYPVLYLLHGVMGSENDMLGYGTTIQNMVADGTAEEMIIVYPNMFSSATSANPSGFNAATMEGYDNFVNDLVNDLMPFVKETCNVKEGKENTAVAGFSMGGREALTIGLFRPDLFGYIGAFAPAPGIVPAKDSFMTHEGTFKEEEVKYEEEAPYLIMICSGDRDSVVGTFPKSYHELYTKNGIDHLWWEIPGSDHGDPATSSGVYNFCKYAFKEQGVSCEHDYESVVTAPDCTEKGYTTYTCALCGRSYTADETAALGHDYQNGACSRCGKAQPAQGGLADIDFTDPAAADQFDVLNQASTEIREGQGLYMVTTMEAFEPCNGQVSTFAPKDVVKVPVGGNWTATLKFTFDPSGSQNGYYQFFGFYASEGEDYNKLAGIRGGDGALQNFLRLDADNINADNNNSEPGLSTAGTYWWRIVKDDTTYTCYRSSDGEEFAEMFAYDETGIEADALVIDAYTGMTAGYVFYVESLEFEGGAAACQHDYKAVVTEPTCTEGGYTTQTCSLCGKERVTNKTVALGHDWDEGVTTKEPTETEAGQKTLTCGRCGETKTQRIPPLNDAPNPYQLLFTSDFHAGLDGFDGFHNLKALLPLLKEEGLNPAVITNGGDYVEDSYGAQANWPEVFQALESVVRTTYPEIAFAWTLGNHDWEWNQMSDAKFKEISGFDRTGMNYANDLYEVYQIGAQGNTTAGVDKEIFWDEDIEAFDQYLASKVGSGKVIFVQTHWPLHRGYNWHWRTVTNAGKMIDTMNKYGDDLDIVFLWGHNHYTDEMRNTIVQRGGSISYAENQSKTIKFTYASVGCMNDMYYLHSGHRDTMQGHGVCLSGELQDDKLVLTYNRIDDAYETVGEGVLTHNADLTLTASNTVLKNPAVVEVQLYNVEGSDVEIPECEHEYKDGVCTKCGEADPNYKPDVPVEGDYVLAETVEAGKQYVVVSNGYALTNKTASVSTANGGTSLASTAVTVKDGIITSEVTPDMIWDFAEGTTTQEGHPYEGFFVTNADSKFLSRGSSGGAGVAPLNTETYDASNVSSKPHYAYWAVEDLEGSAKNMFLYSTNSSDYVFFLRGAAAGFDAPGTAQDGWQSAKSSYPVEFYEIVEGEAECQHDYKAVVTEPTCTEAGFTTYTCSKCGESYVADETAKLGHKYKDGICTVCGEKDPNYVPVVPGDGEYVLATSIEAGKTYVLVADGQYALNNTAVTYGSYGNGTDTLGSTAVTIEGDKIVSEVDDSMLWTVELGEDVPASPIYDEVQYFLYDCNGQQLMRRSGSSGTAPLQAGGTYSRIHYVTISFYERADGSYTVFFNTDRTDDYPFSFSGSASGFNAPGTQQDNWTPETYGSSIRLYEAGEICEHDYKSVVTAPTCTETGYTTYTCELCGHSYVGNETEKVAHNYVKGECTVCGAADPDYKPVEGNFVLAETIEAGKQYVVVSNGYALTNVTTNVSTANGGISLGSTAVTVEDGVITSEVTEDMIWDFETGSTTQADHPYDGFFLTNAGSKYLSRASSGGNGVAPLNTETYDASNVDTKSHYNYWTIADVSGTTKSMFLYSTTSSDYVFFLRGSAEGFDAPGTSQDGWESYQSTYTVELYEVVNGDPGCEHDYEEKVTAPTCTEKGYTTYTCSKCGNTYKDDYVDALGHKYEEVVTKPTCTEKGYTTYTCSVCGDSYKGNETAALGHDYEEVVTKPTCTEKGYTTYTCSVCGDSYKDDYVDVIAHDYKDGVCTVCGAKDDSVHDCPAKDFVDIPAVDHWAHPGIDYAVSNELMNGTGEGKFSPEGTLTRAQLVTILYRVENEPTVELKGTFSDVPADSWYSKAVEWAEANGIVKGIGGGKFAPEAVITREQIATILYRYEAFKNGAPKVEGDLKAFPDAGSVSSFAATAMVWAIENEIITGASVNNVTYLNPLNSATREQIATIIMRYLEAK